MFDLQKIREDLKTSGDEYLAKLAELNDSDLAAIVEIVKNSSETE
jgi:hypothetical protein